MPYSDEAHPSAITAKALFHRAKARFRAAGAIERVAWIAGAAVSSPVVVPLYFAFRARKPKRPPFIRSTTPPPAIAADPRVEARLAEEPDTFALVRVIGNDLPPRHSVGQSRANLDFVLCNEPEFKGCEKFWIVNRIFDKVEEARLVDRLDAADASYEVIPFSLNEYSEIPLDFSLFTRKQALQSDWFQDLDDVRKGRAVAQIHRLKNTYVMNNNGARNRALALGLNRAKWILPFDGNCFMSSTDWDRFRTDIAADPTRQYLVVPMARLGTNEGAFHEISPENADEEPQIAFRRDALERYDEAHPYGRRPKVELLARLGVPGPWVKWPMEPWDLRSRPVGESAHRTGRAGMVRRLASGREDLEITSRSVSRLRGVARADAIVETLWRADAALFKARGYHPERPLFFESDRISTTDKKDSVARAIAEAAKGALRRGPYTVTDKTESPPSGDAHDYYHPAPYWHPNPDTADGLPYIRRDGVRLPGTIMYGEGSERFDRTRWQMMCDDAITCALSWAIHGDPAARDHAHLLIRTWFVESKTAMNPHLRYAQLRLGHNESEGKGTGILELKDLAFLLDAARLVDDQDLSEKLREWLREYYSWLLSSPQGNQEHRSLNNHGVYFDIQCTAIAAFLGETAQISKNWMYSVSRIDGHFDERGAQPHELKRTLTKHYCAYNLQGWLTLLRMYRSCGISIHRQPEVSRVKTGVDWFLAHHGKDWPYKQIDPFDEMRFAPIAFAAAELGFDITPSSHAYDTLKHKPRFDPNNGVPPYWPLIADNR